MANNILGKNFSPSGLNNAFNYHGTSFQEYIAQCQKMIAAARVDLTSQNSAHIIAANSPFECWPDSTTAAQKNSKLTNGILLIHGLLDSPYSLISVANYFKNKGFLVRALLLPGHGTVPGDLLQVNYSEWINAVSFGVSSFAGQVENLYLLGFSTGGNLAIQHALKDTTIKGLFLFSPALRIKSYIVYANQWTTSLRKLLAPIFPKLNWLTIVPEDNYSKYESIAYQAGYQLHLLSKFVAQACQQKQLSIPLFIAASSDDEVIDTQYTANFFQHIRNPNNRMIIYSNDSSYKIDNRIEIVPSAVPAEKILNFSHICIPIAPDHPHYGRFGDYQPLYDPIRVNGFWRTNRATKDVYLGSETLANVKRYRLRRLTYNPLFADLTAKMDRFLHGICDQAIS